MSMTRILAALKDDGHRDYGSAQSLIPAAYHDLDLYALECERLFRTEWICLGRLAEVPKPGDYICRDIVGAPVFVVRQRDESVRAFANVCVHRSAQLLQDSGHVSRISCPYHSWTYELDGQLIGAPYMNETPGFDVGDYRLKEPNCCTWEGFVYVSLDRDAEPLEPRLAGLGPDVADYRMADYVPVHVEEETWDTNWKCLVENYMDAYHVHRVHADSFARYGSSEDITEMHPGGDAYSCHYVQEEEGPNSVQCHPENTWLQGESRTRTWLIHIFPAHTIQLQPDLLWYLSILPVGVDRVSIRWAVSIPAEILDAAKVRQAHIDAVLGLLKQVNSEDRPIVENVFRATRSPDARPGPMSWLERNVWDFHRYLACRLCDQK